MSLRITILILFSFTACISANAQQSEKDSLEKLLSSAIPDSVRSDALNELAFYMFDYNVDSSIQLANQAKEYAAKANNLRQEARSLKNIGISYDIKGKTDSAIYFLNMALDIAKKNNIHPSHANILTDIANAYYAAGNYELALRNHFEALRLREGYGEKKFIAQSYNNISLDNLAIKDYENVFLPKFTRRSPASSWHCAARSGHRLDRPCSIETAEGHAADRKREEESAPPHDDRGREEKS